MENGRFAVHQIMSLHAEALFTQDNLGRLQHVNEPWANDLPSTVAPRFYLGRTSAGHLWRVRADLPRPLIDQLEALCQKEPVEKLVPQMPQQQIAYWQLLNRHQPVQHVWGGPAYALVDPPASSHAWVWLTEENGARLGAGFAKLQDELKTAQPFVGLLVDGVITAVCRSVRISPQAHEAGVETLEAYRGRGYATAVTAQWAKLVQQAGALPLYSTAWDNHASQAIARKLGGVQVGVDFHLT